MIQESPIPEGLLKSEPPRFIKPLIISLASALVVVAIVVVCVLAFKKEPESEIKPDSPKETATQEPETPAEEFDIDYWIAYAKNYATSIGLELDVTAVDCWDNPIAANPKCTTIEENIISRLNRYKNVEEFTAVWIWAEKVSDNGYEIYIGYA